MGLLKHAILPYFAIFHWFTVICMLPFYRNDFVSMAYGKKSNNDELLTHVEHHLLDAAAGFHAAIGFGCIWGIWYETAKFRSVLVKMEVILWFFDWYGSLNVNEIDSTVMAVNLLISIIGLIINYLEPGIFTNDNKRNKQS